MILACGLLLLLTVGARAEQTTLEMLALQHRPAAELIPIIHPLVGNQGAVTGTGYQLIVRATPANLAQIRKALRVLDTAPRNLLITVRLLGAP